MIGYSGTPLAKKLGIRQGTAIAPIGAPPGYLALLEPLPDAVVFARRMSPSVDIVHLFATRRSVLVAKLRACLSTMRPDAAIWVSWPKRTSGVATDITEDVIRNVALPMGLVDIKVCAVDETWSGLKLVIRVSQRSEVRGQK
jgi:hypothetical protein